MGVVQCSTSMARDLRQGCKYTIQSFATSLTGGKAKSVLKPGWMIGQTGVGKRARMKFTSHKSHENEKYVCECNSVFVSF